MNPDVWTIMTELMERAYEIRTLIQHNLPPMARVWAPMYSGGVMKFRVKYKTMPIFYAELTYNQIMKMPMYEAACFSMLHITKQMLERLEE